MSQYIAYFRTGKRFDINQQQVDFNRFVEFNKGTVAGIFIESADARRRWPQLEKALQRAKEVGGTLVIAVAGRWIRNSFFVNLLAKSRVDFCCLDNKLANSGTIHTLAAVAGEEARRVSVRTKEGLLEARKRGVKLGSARPGHWEGREHLRKVHVAQAVAAKLKRETTRAAYDPLIPEIKTRRERGDTIPEIAEWLNLMGYTTTAGMPFTQTAVWRLIERYLGKQYLGRSVRGEQQVREGYRRWRRGLKP